MTQAAVVNSSYLALPLSQIDESTTNPRRTFEPSKLAELAGSIAALGLIQPITVRPRGDRYEIIAGARRFRAAQLAELEFVPARILELSDDEALEVQIVENSQREDIHPYEEAAGYQHLIERPGFNVAAIAAKCGKSESHIYSRLSLLTLIPDAVEAFQQERITAAHANLLARLTPEQQQSAFPQCWRKDFRDGEQHLLAARHLGAWIRQNLYLPLAKAPFDREDAGLFPQAGSCAACPKRSGFNAALFCDLQGDEQCLDAACYQTKIDSHIDCEVAADSELIQIEASWRPPVEQRAGSFQLNEFWLLKEDSPQCDAVRRGIIVYGNRVGTIISVCPRRSCPIHNREVAQAIAGARALAEAQASENHARDEAAARNASQPTEEEVERVRQQEAANIAEQERKQVEAREAELRFAEEAEQRHKQREAEVQRHIKESEAEAKRRLAEQKKRDARFHRMLKQVPETLSPAQVRFVLRAFVNSDLARLIDDVAEQIVGSNDVDQRGAEEVVTAAIDELADNKVSRFAVKLALAWHRNVPMLTETDYLTEAEAAFLPAPLAEEEAKVEAVKRRKA